MQFLPMSKLTLLLVAVSAFEVHISPLSTFCLAEVGLT